MVTTSNCTAAFVCHDLDSSRLTSSAQPLRDNTAASLQSEIRLKKHLEAPSRGRRAIQTAAPRRTQPRRVQAGAAPGRCSADTSMDILPRKGEFSTVRRSVLHGRPTGSAFDILTAYANCRWSAHDDARWPPAEFRASQRLQHLRAWRSTVLFRRCHLSV